MMPRRRSSRARACVSIPDCDCCCRNKLRQHALIRFAEACARGIGQVWLMNSPISGFFFLAAIFVADVYLGIMAVLGVVASTMTAKALGVQESTIANGLTGYNGCLTAIAIGLFHWDLGGPGHHDSQSHELILDWLVLVPAAVLSAFSAILTISLAKVLKGVGLSPLTLPFQLATWCWLLQAKHSYYFPVYYGIESELVENHTPYAIGGGGPPSAATSSSSTTRASHRPHYNIENEEYAGLEAVMRGLSQVFLLNNVWSGILIWIGIACCSRIAAVSALCGSAMGFATAAALGLTINTNTAPGVYDGLYGYNPALTAMCIGGLMFVLDGCPVILLAGSSAVISAISTGAVASFLAPAGLPALTFPFVISTWAFQLLSGSISPHHGFVAVDLASMTTPEEHRRILKDSRKCMGHYFAARGLCCGVLFHS